MINSDAALAALSAPTACTFRPGNCSNSTRAPICRWRRVCHTRAGWNAPPGGLRFRGAVAGADDTSHPASRAWAGETFAELVKDYPLPVYALGGMRPHSLDIALRHGAHGIGLLSGIW